MSTSVRIAAALTRAWVRLYTIAMPADLREARRAEIDADLWDQENDAQENGVPRAVLATEILLRALFGAPDDLSWRFEAIQARRAGSTERSLPMVALSARQMRWMGLGGLLGGILWVGNVLTMYVVSNVIRGYGAIALSVLLIVGLAGFYAQQRERAGKAGKAGFILLLTSFVAFFAMNFLGTFFGVGGDGLFVNLLALAFVFLLPPGFLLLGIGLKGPIRHVPLGIGFAFLAWFVLTPLLLRILPAAANLFGYRGDSPAGMTVFILMGIGLTLMGYSVFRHAAPPASSRQ